MPVKMTWGKNIVHQCKCLAKRNISFPSVVLAVTISAFVCVCSCIYLFHFLVSQISSAPQSLYVSPINSKTPLTKLAAQQYYRISDESISM